MDATRSEMEGMVGGVYDGGEGGGPLYRATDVSIESPSNRTRCSSPGSHGKGKHSSSNSDRDGQWNWPASAAAYCTGSLNGWVGSKPLMPASTNGCFPMGLYSWLYLLSGPSIGSNGISCSGYGLRSAACFLSDIFSRRQCSILYDPPSNWLTMSSEPPSVSIQCVIEHLCQRLHFSSSH